MPDPCVDENLTKIRIYLRTVWTKFSEMPEVDVQTEVAQI
jgi:hypothetical protein